jgi:hypothetical protein
MRLSKNAMIMYCTRGDNHARRHAASIGEEQFRGAGLIRRQAGVRDSTTVQKQPEIVSARAPVFEQAAVLASRRAATRIV